MSQSVTLLLDLPISRPTISADQGGFVRKSSDTSFKKLFDLHVFRSLWGTLELSPEEVHQPIDGIQVIRDEFLVLDRDPVLVFQKRHQLQHAKRVDDPMFQEGVIVRQTIARLAEGEIIYDKST
jgi:hypothetical protein